MCDSACQYDWRWAWLVLTLQPTHPSDTLTHTDTYRAIPDSHLSPSPQQTAVGQPLIATVRWDGPLGFEFQMTEQWSWYGHRGSCWGTVLPLLWPGANRPAPKPLLQPRISSSGAQYHQTWWQSDLIHPSQLIFISNQVADYKCHMFTLTAFIFTYCTFALLIHLLGFTFNLQPKIPPNKKKKSYDFICCKHAFGTLVLSFRCNT